METVIEFTLAEFYHALLGVCGAITAVAAAIGVIAVCVKKAKSPNQKQNERLDSLESKMKHHEELLDNDNTRLKNIEYGNRVTQRALLALLAHGIDGNDIDSMKKAKEELQQYLIEK